MRSDRKQKAKQLVPTTYTLIALVIIVVVVIVFFRDGVTKFAFSVLLHLSLVPFSVLLGLIIVGFLLLVRHDFPGSSKLFGYLANSSLGVLFFKLRALLTTKEKEARPAYGKDRIGTGVYINDIIDKKNNPIISSSTPKIFKNNYPFFNTHNYYFFLLLLDSQLPFG